MLLPSKFVAVDLIVIMLLPSILVAAVLNVIMLSGLSCCSQQICSSGPECDHAAPQYM
jgi:hypothetical protein